jgi:hypothetical protein
LLAELGRIVIERGNLDNPQIEIGQWPLLRRFGCEFQGKYRFAAGVRNFHFPAVAGPQVAVYLA